MFLYFSWVPYCNPLVKIPTGQTPIVPGEFRRLNGPNMEQMPTQVQVLTAASQVRSRSHAGRQVSRKLWHDLDLGEKLRDRQYYPYDPLQVEHVACTASQNMCVNGDTLAKTWLPRITSP